MNRGTAQQPLQTGGLVYLREIRAPFIFVRSGRLANEHDPSVSGPFARDRNGPALGEPTQLADAYLLVQRLEFLHT